MTDRQVEAICETILKIVSIVGILVFWVLVLR